MVQMNGLGFSFHSSTPFRMSASSVWALRWSAATPVHAPVTVPSAVMKLVVPLRK